MTTQRNRCSADFKARLALEVIKGNRTRNAIASEATVHPNLLMQWKRQLLESLPTVFADKRVKDNKEQEALTSQLYQQIGQRKVELDFLKKSRDVSPESLRLQVDRDHPGLSIGPSPMADPRFSTPIRAASSPVRSSRGVCWHRGRHSRWTAEVARWTTSLSNASGARSNTKTSI